MTNIKNALVVDDEIVVSKVLGKFFQRSYGTNVETLTDGAQAAARLSEDPHYFDIILTDQKMPYKTGLELIKEYSGIVSAPMVLVHGGTSEENLEAMAMNAGASGVLNKPFGREDFQASIEEAFRRYQESIV